MKSTLKSVSIIFLLLGLTWSLAASGSGGGIDFSHMLNRISPAVVTVRGLIDPEEGTWSSATGYIIDPRGKVLTACSAVIDAQKVQVTLNDGTVYSATIERCTDDDIDAKIYNIAILQLLNADNLNSQVWLRKDDVRPWENIFLLAHPAPYGELTVTEGMISGQLPRPYLQLERRVFGIWLLAQVHVSWTTGDKGKLTGLGSIIDMDYSNLTLANLADYVRASRDAGWEVLLLGVEEPREDDLFCGIATGTRQGIVQIERISCFWLIMADAVAKRGDTGQLDREVLFYKISAALPSTSSGSTGAPVVDLSGQVVGMLSWGRGVEVITAKDGDLKEIRTWPGAHYIIPVEVIRQFLSK